MRHENDRLLPLREDLLDVAVELITRERVEGRERLIHQEHARIRGKRASEGHALAHATRKLVWVRLLLVGQADEIQVVASGFGALGVGEARLEAQAEEHVLEGIEPREERILLEHHEPIAARLDDISSVELD